MAATANRMTQYVSTPYESAQAHFVGALRGGGLCPASADAPHEGAALNPAGLAALHPHTPPAL